MTAQANQASMDIVEFFGATVLAVQAVECWVVIIHPKKDLPLIVALGGPESEAVTIEAGDEKLRLELRQPGPTSYVAGGVNGSDPRRLLFVCDYRGNFKIHVQRCIYSLEGILSGQPLVIDPTTNY